MNISKTTLNFARARQLDITVWSTQDGEPYEYAVWFEQDENVPAFIVYSTPTGFFLKTNHQLDASVWEELPHWMRSETTLREVLNYVHNNQIV